MKDRNKLLGAPYRPPALRVGDQATCLYRDCDVIVTGWTDALISWPPRFLFAIFITSSQAAS